MTKLEMSRTETDLLVAIHNLKGTISIGSRLLGKLEKQQKDLEAPPQHKWEHGDVFKNDSAVEMIYIKRRGVRAQVFCLGACTGHDEQETRLFLIEGKFLFNIKEKL